MKPTVTLRCPAAAYDARDERTVEASWPDHLCEGAPVGCLLNLRTVKQMPVLDVNRADPPLRVRAPLVQVLVLLRDPELVPCNPPPTVAQVLGEAAVALERLLAVVKPLAAGRRYAHNLQDAEDARRRAMATLNLLRDVRQEG